MPNWSRSHNGLWCVVLMGLLVASSSSAAEPDDEDDEPVRFPGIVGTYTASGQSRSRRDIDIAFAWDKQSPLQQLPAGPFQVQWQGKLLVRAPGKYRFYAQLQGNVTASLNNQSILTGQTDAGAPAKWISGPEVEFEYGEHPLVVSFQSVEPAARLKLYWSSEAFAFEPIPSGAFFLNAAQPELELVAKGQELFAAHRCNRCHQREHDPQSPSGPDLTHVAYNLTKEQLESWFSPVRPEHSPHFNMPEFGFTAAESQAVASFLRAKSTELKPSPEVPPQDARKPEELQAAGRTLLHTTGCLACHSYGEVGSTSRLGGGDLSKIGAKRSAEWLRIWLTDPKQLNADHRMPVYAWARDAKRDELSELVAFLANSLPTAQEHPPKAEAAPSTPDPIESGRKLVEAARCAACHRIPGVEKPVTAGLPTLEKLNAESLNSCLQVKPNRENWRPGFPEKDLDALRAYLKHRAGTVTPEGPVERGQRVLAWNNCLQCHPREGAPGLGAYAVSITKLLPELGGAVPTLVPPSLNAVGDKLRDDVLLKSVAGEFPGTRLPWLKVRMPKFWHSAEDRAALARSLTDHDRIESPPTEWVTMPPVPDATQRVTALAVGHTLLGSQGFSCIACHQFGKFQPKNAALGTRGSDLQNIGNRIRREYFLRWTRSPIRIVPDMEMPGYERPFPELLGSQIQPQLAALWEALHDPSPQRPLDVASLQQSLVVRSGEPARIVRDVFALPTAGRPDATVPRAFAVGLNNQHNILFDLDTFVVREWWQGGFARQRTEGKSWYWDAGGARIMSGLVDVPNLALVLGASSKIKGELETRLEILLPNVAEELLPRPTPKTGRLVNYSILDNGVSLDYRLDFSRGTAGVGKEVSVTENWYAKPAGAGDRERGWYRVISVSGVPAGYRPVFVRPHFDMTKAQANVAQVPEKPDSWYRAPNLIPGFKHAIAIADLAEAKPGTFDGTFHYTINATPVAIPSPVLTESIATQESYSTVPGFSAVRLPLPRSIMPTTMTWTEDDVLAFTSLKGHVYLARDTNNDGLEDKLDLYEEGLAAPYGIISDPADGSLLVSHKPEILRLTDTNKDGRVDRREVFATGWGYNDNYHDWTCGIVRDNFGNLFVGLGSDYTQPNRSSRQLRWRGKILRITPQGEITPIASGLRYPTGLAMTHEGDLFVSDNQGEQNTFNELNHIVEGKRYGVPSNEDKAPFEANIPPAIQFPHPWTRSINGIFFLPPYETISGTVTGANQSTKHPFAGHGIGCEYDSRYLIRFTLQKVADTFQGAVYPFSQDQLSPETPNFEGTLCGGVSPKGDIYIGCIHDSGWLGGLNVGSIVQLKSNGQIPLGIRELRAVPEGFEIQFTAPVDGVASAMIDKYTISGYTREWKGTYATPDSNRHVVPIKNVKVSSDGLTVVLHTDKLKTGYVYEVSCGKIGPKADVALWPATGHYTMNRLP